MRNRQLRYIPLVLAVLAIGIMFTGSTGKWMTLGSSVVHAIAPICDQTPWTLPAAPGWGQIASVTLPAPANGCNRHIITSISATLMNATSGTSTIAVIELEDGSTVKFTDALLANYPSHGVDHIDPMFPITPDGGAYEQYGWTGIPANGILTVKFLSVDANAYEAINVHGFDIPCNGNNGGNPGAC